MDGDLEFPLLLAFVHHHLAEAKPQNPLSQALQMAIFSVYIGIFPE
jgi:hypothetical protein